MMELWGSECIQDEGDWSFESTLQGVRCCIYLTISILKWSNAIADGLKRRPQMGWDRNDFFAEEWFEPSAYFVVSTCSWRSGNCHMRPGEISRRFFLVKVYLIDFWTTFHPFSSFSGNRQIYKPIVWVVWVVCSIQACQCFLPSLFWSMVLLLVFMSMGTLIMGNLLRSFIENPSNPMEDRIWIWNRYGTAYRALYTLYEATWLNSCCCSPWIEHIHHPCIEDIIVYHL